MQGQWFYDEGRDSWSMVIRGRHEMSIPGEVLRALCEKVGATTEAVLAWVGTRPSGPWPVAAVAA